MLPTQRRYRSNTISYFGKIEIIFEVKEVAILGGKCNWYYMGRVKRNKKVHYVNRPPLNPDRHPALCILIQRNLWLINNISRKCGEQFYCGWGLTIKPSHADCHYSVAQRECCPIKLKSLTNSKWSIDSSVRWFTIASISKFIRPYKPKFFSTLIQKTGVTFRLVDAKIMDYTTF